MRTDDCAIVVGVARYFDSASFPTLRGPVNDVARMVDWLTSPSGGDVPPENIRTLRTEDDLLNLLESPTDDDVWQPSRARIEQKIHSLVLDNKRKIINRPNGRLYLYFSGHGFTSDREDVRSAALFTAEAGGMVQANICGTLCAEALSRLAAFGQIVLIMDCCRDVKLTVRYDGLMLADASAPGSERVSVLSIYAAPKGGKAQEGALVEGGPTVGFMTHALLTSLREMPPDILGRVSASALDNYLAMNWATWFNGPTAPPKPRILLPYSDQAPIYFTSGRPDLVDQEFSVPAARDPGLELWLLSSLPASSALPVIKGTVAGDHIHWARENVDSQLDVPLSAPDAQGRQRFTLRLLKIPYEIYASDPPGSKRDFIGGDGCVDL
jgi:caspase domain-containing protein